MSDEKLEDPAAGDWHIDKRIPVALLVALCVQAAAGIWWASGINARVAVLESAVINTRQDGLRLERIEATVVGINQRLERMEDRR